MTNWELAYKDYKDGMKYKDIAGKYDVSINTVKSWKSRKWNEIEKGATPNEKGATPNEKVAHKQKKVAHKKEVQLVIDNDDLTEQQKMFCIYYLQSFNATKAYRQAYTGVTYETANSHGYKLLSNVVIKKEITRLKAELQQEVHIDTKHLLNELARQLHADIKDFVEFGQEIATNPDTGESYIKSYMRFKDMDEVDGTLIDSIKLGKDGVSVQLPNKQKALEMLLKHLDIDEGAADSKVVFIDNEDAMRKELGEYDGTY